MNTAPCFCRCLLASILLLTLWSWMSPDSAADEAPLAGPIACDRASAVSASAPSAQFVAAPPLFAGFFQDVVGSRSRVMQAAFICIVIGIFILWKK